MSWVWLRSGIARKLAIVAALAAAFGIGTCVSGGDSADHGHGEHAEGDETVWTCSMHPQVRSSEPGKCPYCGMNLIPAGDLDDDGGDDPRRISLSERARVLAGIRTTAVRPILGRSGEVRLLGRIDYDETRVKTVTAWTNGRIERLHVAAKGERLRKGQVIATIYSPEIYGGQSDLIQAARQLQRLESAAEPARKSAAAALESARQRLRLLGVSEAELDRMQKADQPSRQVGIRTPFAGTVIDRLVDEGNYVEAGTALYRIADLSKVWVQLDAYESDLPHLAVGQTVALEVKGLPGKRLEGKVTFIDPVVDAQRRTARVRVVVSNDEGALRPGMYTEALVRSADDGPAADDADPPLVIPDTAPLFTGRRSIVYVEVPGGDRPTYEAREVSLGSKLGQLYPVLAGLEAGERVVTRGAFAIDADLQIRGGESMMTRPDDLHRREAEPVEDVPEQLTRHLAHIVRSYLAIQEALADDDLETARQGAAHLEDALRMARDAAPARLRSIWDPMDASMTAYARHFRNTPSLTRARHDFEGLSLDVVALLQRFGNPLDEPVRLAYCPMAADDRGAEWVQRGEEVRNAYYGEEMLTCGEVRGTVGPGSHLERHQQPEAAPAAGHEH